MFNVLGIDHLVLRTEDAPRLLDFYQTHLGLTLERSETDLGLYQLRAGNALIDIVPVNQTLGQQKGSQVSHSSPNLDHFCLQIHCASLADVRAHLLAKGVPCSELAERYGAEGFGMSFYITDPDGNDVELKCAIK